MMYRPGIRFKQRPAGISPIIVIYRECCNYLHNVIYIGTINAYRTILRSNTVLKFIL